MLTKSPKAAKVKSLSIESLESRLNLSRFGVSAFVPHSFSTVRLSHVQSSTYSAIRPSTSLTSAVAKTTSDPYANLLFGDTALSSSSTSNVPVTGYSVMSGAQIEYVNGTPDVGYMSTSGADIEYKVTVTAPGTYKLNLGVASSRWGSFDVLVNGSTAAQYSFNATGGFQNYATTSQNVTLSAGTNVLKISPTWASQFNINAISLSPVSVSAGTTSNSSTTTTVGTSASVPVANYSAISNCKLENQSTTPDIGYVSTSGSYVEYTLNVQTAGNYNVAVGTSAVSSASMNLLVNGTQTANYAIGSTGSWSNYSTNTKSVYLSAGTVTLRFASAGGTQYNISAINISQASTAPTTTGAKTVTTVSASGATLPIASYSAISNSQLENNNGDIGYVSASGAYVEYTLNVQSAGNYNLTASTASASAASFAVAVNGTSTATYSLPSTGSWTSYANTTKSVYLPAGTVTLRISSLNGTQYNLSWLNLTPATSSSTTTTTTTPSAPATTTTSSSTGFDASVSTQWMSSFNQLNIVTGSKNDSVYVSQSGNTIAVNVNGTTNYYNGPYGNIVVKAGSGNDTITVDSSVNMDTLVYGGSGSDTLKNLTSGKATIVSIGGGYDSVQGNGSNTAYWVDSSDGLNASSTEWNNGDVHQVSSFWNGVSTQLQGQNLSDPSGTGATTRISNASLWGTGPTVADVNQGQSSDCFVLGALQTLAYNKPNVLRQTMVDLGDGTYAVQFKRNGATTYVRVDADLPSNGPYANGLEYAHPGSSGDLWMPIFEKAYAEYRTGSFSYSSLNEGYFGAVLGDLGVSYSTFGASGADSVYNTIANALNSGKGVTIGTNGNINSGAPLIYSHTYTVTAAWTSGGTEYLQLRNPWGFDGAGNDSNGSDGLVTMTAAQLNSNLQAGTIS